MIPLKKNTHRTSRVGHEIQRFLSSLIVQGGLPPLAEHETPDRLIAITRVDVSPDVKNATVFYTHMDAAVEKAARLYFEAAASRIRGMMGQAIQFRHTPRLRFVIDLDVKKKSRIDSLLEKVGQLPPPEDEA